MMIMGGVGIGGLSSCSSRNSRFIRGRGSAFSCAASIFDFFKGRSYVHRHGAPSDFDRQDGGNALQESDHGSTHDVEEGALLVGAFAHALSDGTEQAVA